MKQVGSALICLSCFFGGKVFSQIQFIESVVDGQDGLEGLNKVNRVVISPDGKHLYTTSSGDHSVGIFSRDASGSLQYVDHIKDGVGGMEGLEGANGLAVSPDGKNVYVTAWDDAAITVFSRDAFSGNLSMVSVHRNGEGKLHKLEGINSIAVSPDGRHVYAGSFLDDALCRFDREEETGKLSFNACLENGKKGALGLDGISALAFSPDGRSLYVTAWQEGSVSAYSRDFKTGELTLTARIRKGVLGGGQLEGVNSLSISPNGRFLYAGSYHDGSVTVFEREASGGLRFVMNTVKSGMEQHSGIQSICLSPDGSHLYALSFRDPVLAVYNRDGHSGRLSFAFNMKSLLKQKGQGGGYSIAVSPDGAQIYVVDYKESALVVFERNLHDGALTYAMALMNGQGGVEGLYGVRSLAMSPDGRYVYTAAFEDNALSVFERDASRGHLRYRTHYKDGVEDINALSRVSSVVVSPDGYHVYAAAYGENALSIFTRNGDSGELGYVTPIRNGISDVQGLDGVYGLAISPDGRNVYTAASGANALGVFKREQSTGNLIYQNHFTDGTGEIEGLEGANSVTVSPDGLNVYVTGFYDNSLSVFSRDPESGALAYMMELTNGENGVEGLGWVNSVTVSPDGKHVYTASWKDDAVALFERDQTGKLRFLSAIQDGRDIANGLNGATYVTVSPNGEYVYVSTWSDGGMVVFNRDPGTGALSYVTCFIDRIGDVDKLKGAFSVLTSPRGEHIYVAASADRTVNLFKSDVPEVIGELEPELNDQLFTFSMPGHTLYSAPNGKVQRVQIKDLAGHPIRDVPISSQNVIWDETSSLKPGPYMVEINSGTQSVKKVVWVD